MHLNIIFHAKSSLHSSHKLQYHLSLYFKNHKLQYRLNLRQYHLVLHV